MHKCPTYEVSQYKVKDDECSNDESTNKDRPTKVCIRCSLTIAAIEQPSSSQHSISKKRKTTASFQLRSSDTQFPDTTVSPEASVSSTGTVVSGDFCSDRSCCSSSHFKDLHSVPSDLQTKGFQTVEDSTNRYFKPFRFLFYLFFVRVLSHVFIQLFI
ncbi:uncharacterized protein [Glycine max]|uniref:uncharacterized protein n=1 Tax=Glycine max TaxID=3847 RepID=UPI001B3549DA|nr:uncharacterized protein LOC121172953 [Glycine max]